MSINRDPTLKVAGLHLTDPCFSHGQLYVGCSRVGSSNDPFVLAPQNDNKKCCQSRSLEIVILIWAFHFLSKLASFFSFRTV